MKSINKVKMFYNELSDTSPSPSVSGNTNYDISRNVSNSGIDGAWRGKDKPVLEGFEFGGFTVSADMVEAILELDEERKNKNE